MKQIVITNNPMVNEKFERNKSTMIEYRSDFSYMDILKEVRDYIHKGHKLLTHPLSGSIKPNQTPYETVIVSEEKSALDYDSLALIEDSIMTTQKFLNDEKPRITSEKILNDFQLIDYDLVKK